MDVLTSGARSRAMRRAEEPLNSDGSRQSPMFSIDQRLRHETFNPGAMRDGGISRRPVRTPVSSQERDQPTLEFASGEEVNRTIESLIAHVPLRSIRGVFFQTARPLFLGHHTYRNRLSFFCLPLFVSLVHGQLLYRFSQ